MSPASHSPLPAALRGDATPAAVEGGELPRQAKTRKGKRALQEREAQEHEAIKRLLLLRGSRASVRVQEMLADLRDMKKPDVVFLHSMRKRREGVTDAQSFHPFEDVSSGEFLCEKNNCGFFCLGSTSKKRPARLVFARMFAHQLLDMYEMEVSRYTCASAFRGKEKPHVGSTPIVLLQGAYFETSEALKGLRNLLADLFRGSAQADPFSSAASSASRQRRLYLTGIDRVIAITALEELATANGTAAVAAGRAEDAAAAALKVAVRSSSSSSTALRGGAAAATEETSGEGGSEERENAEEAVSAPKVDDSERPKETEQGSEGKALICLRQYRVVMKKGAPGSSEPRVELEEVGPRIDMRLDRCRLADSDRWKRATVFRPAATAAERKKHEEAQAALAAATRNRAARRGAAGAVVPAGAGAQRNKKKRKTTTTALGDVVGKVYVDKPDWRSLNAQKNVLLIRHNRKRAKLAAQEAAAETIHA